MSLIGLPFRIVRTLVHAVTGGGQTPPPAPRPADPWERRGLGMEVAEPGPPEAASDSHAHSHDHGHSHGHSHSHDAPPEPEGPVAFSLSVVESPNPQARKYVANRMLVEGPRTMAIHSPFDARGSALGEALFAVDGVNGVVANDNQVTVLRSESADWDALDGPIRSALETLFGG